MRTSGRNQSAVNKLGQTSNVTRAASGVQEELKRDSKRRACATSRKRKEKVSMVNDLLKSVMAHYVDHSPATANPNIDAAAYGPQGKQSDQAQVYPVPAGCTSPNSNMSSVSFPDHIKGLSSSVIDDHQPHKTGFRRINSCSSHFPATIPTKQQLWLMIVERLREDIIKARDIHRADRQEKAGRQYLTAAGEGAVHTNHNTMDDSSQKRSPCDLCKDQVSSASRVQQHRPAIAVTVCQHYLCWQCLCQWHQKDSVAPSKKECPYCKKILAKNQVTFLGDIEEPVNISHGSTTASSTSSGNRASPQSPASSSTTGSLAALPDYLTAKKSLSIASHGKVLSHQCTPDECYKTFRVQECYQDTIIPVSSPISNSAYFLTSSVASETGRQSYPDIPSNYSMGSFSSFPSQAFQTDALLNGVPVRSAATSIEGAGLLGSTGISSSNPNHCQIDTKLIVNQAFVGRNTDTAISITAEHVTTCPNQGVGSMESNFIHPLETEMSNGSRHSENRINLDNQRSKHQNMVRDYFSRLLEKSGDVSSTNPFDMEVLNQILETVNLDTALENPIQSSWLSMLIASLQDVDDPTNGQQMTQLSVINLEEELCKEVCQSVANAAPSSGISIGSTLQQEDIPITVPSIVQSLTYPLEVKRPRLMDMVDISRTTRDSFSYPKHGYKNLSCLVPDLHNSDTYFPAPPLPTPAALDQHLHVQQESFSTTESSLCRGSASAHQNIARLSTEAEAFNKADYGSHVCTADDGYSSEAHQPNRLLVPTITVFDMANRTSGDVVMNIQASSGNHHCESDLDAVFDETWDWSLQGRIFTL